MEVQIKVLKYIFMAFIIANNSVALADEQPCYPPDSWRPSGPYRDEGLCYGCTMKQGLLECNCGSKVDLYDWNSWAQLQITCGDEDREVTYGQGDLRFVPGKKPQAQSAAQAAVTTNQKK